MRPERAPSNPTALTGTGRCGVEASAGDRRTSSRWGAGSGLEGPPPAPSTWEGTARTPRLRTGEIHVFRTPLEVGDGRADDLRAYLSESELERIDALGDPDAARRTAVGRGLLRLLLGGYLDLDPAKVPLADGRRGKPVLDPTGLSVRLHFNHARSGGLGVYAFTTLGPVGVDVERVRPLPDLEERTGHFSAVERDTLRKLPPGLRAEGFFQCWTRKQALLKASGGELPCSLRDFDVSLTPGVPARVYRWRDVSGPPGRWTLLHLRPEPGYVGAAAVRGSPKGLRTWSWEADAR